MDLPPPRTLPSESRAAQRARVVADVGSRARRRRAMALALAAAAALAAPALAFRGEVVDFFSSAPAPERIQKDFDELRRRHAELPPAPPPPPGISPRPRIAPVGEAREVMTVSVDGVPRPLWVVPIEGGGYCYRWHFMGSCGGIPDFNAETQFSVGGLQVGGRAAAGHGLALALIQGHVNAREIDELRLVYEDGESVKLPFVWVSEPIDAGFYAFEIPETHRQPGRYTAYVVALSSDGDEVGRRCLLRPERCRR